MRLALTMSVPTRTYRVRALRLRNIEQAETFPYLRCWSCAGGALGNAISGAWVSGACARSEPGNASLHYEFGLVLSRSEPGRRGSYFI